MSSEQYCISCNSTYYFSLEFTMLPVRRRHWPGQQQQQRTDGFRRSSLVHSGKQLASHVRPFASCVLPWYVHEEHHWHAWTCLLHGTSSGRLISLCDKQRGCSSTVWCRVGHWNFVRVGRMIHFLRVVKASLLEKKVPPQLNLQQFCSALQQRSFKPAATGTRLNLCLFVHAEGCVSKCKRLGGFEQSLRLFPLFA